MQRRRHTLPKAERVASRTTVEELFGGGHSRGMSAFPLRLVYMLSENGHDGTGGADGSGSGSVAAPVAQILVSVPKKCFKRAVKRNRVKRQVREAYRLAKQGVTDAMAQHHPGRTLVMAFICIDSSLHSSDTIGRKVRNLLGRLEEKLAATASATVGDGGSGNTGHEGNEVNGRGYAQ